MQKHQLVLDIEIRDQGTVIGHVADPSGRRVDFGGWLALASAIETLAGSARGSRA